MTLKLAPGTAVSEAELSSHLGIGRTPIREALQRLARERLVTILPRRGVMVSEINVSRQLRLHEARRELERLIARTAARRATDEQRTRFRELARDFEKSARSQRRRRLSCAPTASSTCCARAPRITSSLPAR